MRFSVTVQDIAQYVYSIEADSPEDAAKAAIEMSEADHPLENFYTVSVGEEDSGPH